MLKIETKPNTLTHEQCHYSTFEVFEIIESSWPEDSFMDVKIVGPVIFIILNNRHDFYKKIYLRVRESEKGQELEALEFLLLSYAKAWNDSIIKNYDLTEQLDLFNQMWGNAMKYFLAR